jgi:aspartate/glutamate racemase
MKTIGLIGGMSWESSVEYYRILNQTIGEKLGGLHSVKSFMVSVDFAEMVRVISSAYHSREKFGKRRGGFCYPLYQYHA